MNDVLKIFEVEVYLDTNIHVTSFHTFAKTDEDAITFVRKYIEHYVTDVYAIQGSRSIDIAEGVVLV